MGHEHQRVRAGCSSAFYCPAASFRPLATLTSTGTEHPTAVVLTGQPPDPIFFYHLSSDQVLHVCRSVIPPDDSLCSLWWLLALLALCPRGIS